MRTGTLSQTLLDCFQDAVERRRNVLISGGTSSGKTTLLTALAAFISDEDRIVLIEDTSEVQITKPNLVRFEALCRWRNRELGEVSPARFIPVAESRGLIAD